MCMAIPMQVLRMEGPVAVCRSRNGIERVDTEYILSTFPLAIQRDLGLAERVLEAWDRITAAIDSGKPFASTVDPPPGHGRRHQEQKR